MTVCLTALLVCVLLVPAAYAGGWQASHYDLTINVYPAAETLSARAEINLINAADQPQSTVSLLLYRLLTVRCVAGRGSQPLPFTQRVTALADEPSWQVNAVELTLPAPIAPRDSTRIFVAYSGFIYGYPEVMAYTRERISEKYTLIRDDVLSYPVIAAPSYKDLSAGYGDLFTYRLAVNTPLGFTAACGGRLISIDSDSAGTRFVFGSKSPVSRIDLGIARFGVQQDSSRRFTVYSLPEDSLGAGPVLRAIMQASAYYTGHFGPSPKDTGFTVIEIPDGWGSQAGAGYILQTAAAFRDTTRLGEVYHEVGHSWNANAARGVQRCRYFDEAFASYFESMALGALRGDSVGKADLESSRDWYVKSCGRDSLGRTVPIAEYGQHEIGGFSYTKGAWSLYVLHQLMGDQRFDKFIRLLVATYSDNTVDFPQFQRLAEKVSGRKLGRFFEEWIYGTASSQLLFDAVPVDSIVARYR